MIAVKKVGSIFRVENPYIFEWVVNDFSSFNIATGKCIKSTTFLLNHIKWHILLFPKGINEENKEYVSICLCSNIVTIAECELSALNVTRTFTFNNKIYTDKKFIPHNIVFSRLINNVLTINIKFSFIYNYEKHYYKLLTDFGLLLESEDYADVVLVSDDKSEYKAHKAILACRSKVFSAMFQHNMKESQNNIVQVKDIDSETLSLMINFLYTGKILLVDCNTDLLIKLLIAADKYDIKDLKEVCIAELLGMMNFDNILQYIEVGDTYNINKLKLIAKDYFLKNRKEILSIERREKLKNLSRHLIEELLCDLAD